MYSGIVAEGKLNTILMETQNPFFFKKAGTVNLLQSVRNEETIELQGFSFFNLVPDSLGTFLKK